MEDEQSESRRRTASDEADPSTSSSSTWHLHEEQSDQAGPASRSEVTRVINEGDAAPANHRSHHRRRRHQHRQPRNYLLHFATAPDTSGSDSREDVWSCLVILVAFWFFAASATLILGFYGSVDLQLGPDYSRLITANQLFVESIKVNWFALNLYFSCSIYTFSPSISIVRPPSVTVVALRWKVQQLDDQIQGPMLYGFHKKPSLDVETTWSEAYNASIQPDFHKEWVYFLNKGSRVHISYQVKHPSSAPVSLVIAQGSESLIEWIEDPSYPNTTLSWNIIHGSGKIEQKITDSATYFIAVGNLNYETVEVELNFTLKALTYNSSEAYSKCSLYNCACTFDLFLFKANYVVLSSVGSEQAKAEDGRYLSLSYGPRWITYFFGSAVMTILFSLAFKYCYMFDQSQGDDGGGGGRESQSGGSNAIDMEDPLLSPKDDDSSSWGSSYDSVTSDEDDLEASISENLVEGNVGKEGENNSSVNPRIMCVICFDSPRDCFFLPCGHCAACFTCGSRIAEEAGTITLEMGLSSRHSNTSGVLSSLRSPRIGVGVPRSPSYMLPLVCTLALLSLAAVVMLKVEDFAYQTKTVAGHNLNPTPWHLFDPQAFEDQTSYARASKILQCHYFTSKSTPPEPHPPHFDPSRSSTCPEFFRWIHKDLEPWSTSHISLSHLMEAKDFAAYRIIISGGRLYVDLYYACTQTRMMFTIWGILQLLKRYPGIVPDVDMMFDCMDKPAINRTEHHDKPLPLFRYCTTLEHFDIPFPDWSFWGWPETNLGPWDYEFADIKKGAKSKRWTMRQPFAHWKGNPDVGSPIRMDLLQCNDTKLWRAQILRQDWVEEAKSGFKDSKLSNQCKHRYKIYAEGYAWSVSLKYIISCGSLALLINPQYEDFFTRGLIPKKNYWPVSRDNMCQSIKFAVNWGNEHPDVAEAMGKEGQDFMESLSMRRVYDYMFHLISEYSKLLDYKPVPPPSAREVCTESLLCFGDEKQRQYLEQSATALSPAPPCTLQEHDDRIIQRWKRLKQRVNREVGV